MQSKQLAGGIGAATGLVLLILDRETAVAGAQTGLQQCIQIVIPCLLPFFLLSNLVTACLTGCTHPILKPLERFCHLPEHGGSFLVTAFLGGYPMGAQAVASAWHKGQITQADAEHMLFFCSNAGPAFLFGILGPLFKHPMLVWSLWIIHILCALFIGFLTPANPGAVRKLDTPQVNFSAAMHSAIYGVASVCGWVICFRTLTAFCGKWFLCRFPVAAQVVFTGLLELVNGCTLLPLIDSEAVRYILCAGFLGFGGLCVLMQTISVIGGLPIRNYIVGRLLHCFLSMAAAASVVLGFWHILLCIAALFVVILMKIRQDGSICRANAV